MTNAIIIDVAQCTPSLVSMLLSIPDFRRAMFYRTGSPADEYCRRRAELLFEKDLAKSRIEVRCQTSCELDPYCLPDNSNAECSLSRTISPNEANLKLVIVNLNPEKLKDFIDACSQVRFNLGYR